MKETEDLLPKLVVLDLKEDQKEIFSNFCNENLKKNSDTVTYSDMWMYVSSNHIRDIKHNETHTEIMKIMWGIFMKKDPYHSKLFYNLIPRDETRKMIEGLYKLLIKNDWL